MIQDKRILGQNVGKKATWTNLFFHSNKSVHP